MINEDTLLHEIKENQFKETPDPWELLTQDNCPVTRNAFEYALRPDVTYQSGHGTESPALIFADADTELHDGGNFHEDGKYVNEPAIIYVRSDIYLHQAARIAELEKKILDAHSQGYTKGKAAGDAFGAGLKAHVKKLEEQVNTKAALEQIIAEAKATERQKCVTELKDMHVKYMTSKGRNPKDYHSHYLVSAMVIQKENT